MHIELRRIVADGRSLRFEKLAGLDVLRLHVIVPRDDVRSARTRRKR